MDPLTFYFDRCFGKRFPAAVKSIRPPQIAVEYHHDTRCRFRFRQETPDDEWLSKIGAAGWIAFSHDRRFHTEEPSYKAIKQHNIGCFYLWGGQDLCWEKLRSFVRAYDKIIEVAQTEARPFIFDVERNGNLKRVTIP